MTNADLQIAYKIYNKQYFSNALPNDMVVEFSSGVLPKAYAVTRFYKNRPLFILIDKKFRPMKGIALMNLLHEMVHVALPKVDGHGAPFQKRMLQLAKAGAFNKLW